MVGMADISPTTQPMKLHAGDKLAIADGAIDFLDRLHGNRFVDIERLKLRIGPDPVRR